MADEKLGTDDERVDAVEEQVEDVVTETVFESVEEPTEEVVPETTVDSFSEKVEAAVQHVAEEAEHDAEEAKAVVETVFDKAVEEAPAKKRERRSKQAYAAKHANDPVEQAAPAKASGLAALGVPVWIAISAACLVLGLVLGHFVLGGGGSSDIAGLSTVSEAELDKTFATYTYNGKTNTISIREAIEKNGALTDFATEDGNYTLPSAEYALNAARSAILDAEVESRGIEVSDDDVKAYAEQALGTSDFEAIGSTYGMDAEAVEALIVENCRLNLLREEVVGDTLPAMPEAPTAPEEGKENEVTKEYADYIIEIAGDAWNAKKKTWKESDSSYATALADSDFTVDGASYSTAQTAYYVAYQEYTQKQTELGNTWTEYLNGLLSNASIEIGSLVS